MEKPGPVQIRILTSHSAQQCTAWTCVTTQGLLHADILPHCCACTCQVGVMSAVIALPT